VRHDGIRQRVGLRARCHASSVSPHAVGRITFRHFGGRVRQVAGTEDRSVSATAGAAAGYGEDQRWTLARIRRLIGSMFKVKVSLTTTWDAMQRLRYSARMPTHRAIERDEAAIALAPASMAGGKELRAG
jgi:hypothetical protein